MLKPCVIFFVKSYDLIASDTLVRAIAPKIPGNAIRSLGA